MKKLLIVESPGKIKKIKEYLGDGWDVKASVGHICDLPQNELGIDKLNGFKLQYKVLKDKEETVEKLKFAVRDVGKDNVYLATDQDREGEAISFHLCKNLGLDYKFAKRITFQEITKTAILSAIQKPRMLDLQLVAAQEARRAIDRLVGFEISPVLWRKIGKGAKSAGRVQSVAVKLIVEREKDIEKFGTQFSFKVWGFFETPGHNKLKAQYTSSFDSGDKAKEFMLSLLSQQFSIISVTKEPKETAPQPPFSTSTLQQDASKKLKFSVDKTMKVAQSLYEGGHITYMRTDSVNLSDTAISELSDFVKETFGPEYVQVRKFKNKNDSAQEAHEAIRPTHFDLKEIDGSNDEQQLYKLIYLRAVASQMKAKLVDVTTFIVNSERGGTEFKANASVVIFDGFTKAYAEELEEDREDDDHVEISEALKEGDSLKLISAIGKQVYSKPKNRFDEADLVKELERLGIGRPSTYASIMFRIKDDKKYIIVGDSEGKKYETFIYEMDNVGKIREKKTLTTLGQAKGKLMPSPIAYPLIAFLQTGFERIMDYKFTAKCEESFDLIAQGKEGYGFVVKDFYTELDRAIITINSTHQDIEKEDRERKTIDVGTFEGAPLRAGKGDKGVYIVHKDKFYSVDEVSDHLSVTLDIAVAAIKHRREEKETNTLYSLGKHKIINGKFGPYITNGKDTAPVPKFDQEKMDTYDEAKCKEVIKEYKKYKKSKK